MSWQIEWRAKDGMATHTSGPSFLVTRTGWVTVRDPDGRSDDAAKKLVAELHELFANVAQKGESIR